MESTKVHHKLLPFPMKKPAAVALNSQIAISSESPKYRKEGTLTSYSELRYSLLETYATEYVIT